MQLTFVDWAVVAAYFLFNLGIGFYYKNRAGKVFTLSPWPIETYWAWTRAVDASEYVLT